MVHVGLDYLTLDRGSSTLSGGEGQRISLATQIGSSLVGVLYILDEPSIGCISATTVGFWTRYSGSGTSAIPSSWWNTTRKPSGSRTM